MSYSTYASTSNNLVPSDSYSFNSTTNEISIHKGGRTITFIIGGVGDNQFQKAAEINDFVSHVRQMGRVDVSEDIKSRLNYKL